MLLSSDFTTETDIKPNLFIILHGLYKFSVNYTYMVQNIYRISTVYNNNDVFVVQESPFRSDCHVMIHFTKILFARKYLFIYFYIVFNKIEFHNVFTLRE